MIEITPGLLDNILAVTAHGTVTAEDYENVLLPAVAEVLKRHKKIRLLFRTAGDFSGYTAGAMWDDAKLGVRHITAFEKIAVVSDVPWLVQATKFFRFLLPCLVKIFGSNNMRDAEAWIRE
ncbi:MAG: STAS/SEC14 domain-containing protein [Candidatus Udaeobacter sp.]